MVKHTMTAVLVAAGLALAAGTLLSRPALALSSETYSLDPNSPSNLASPNPKTYQLYTRNNDDDSSDSSSNNDSPHGLSFGSPSSGFSFSVGHGGGSSDDDSFARRRLLGNDPDQR